VRSGGGGTGGAFLGGFFFRLPGPRTVEGEKKEWQKGERGEGKGHGTWVVVVEGRGRGRGWVRGFEPRKGGFWGNPGDKKKKKKKKKKKQTTKNKHTGVSGREKKQGHLGGGRPRKGKKFHSGWVGEIGATMFSFDKGGGGIPFSFFFSGLMGVKKKL